MKLFLIFAVLFLSIVFSLCDRKDWNSTWNSWKGTHKKSYKTNSEDVQRFKTYKQNVEYIDHHNSLYKAGKVTYEMGINQYADLTFEEFQSKYTGLMTTKKDLEKIKSMAVNTSALPKLSTALQAPLSLDWNSRGYVTSVKKQGTCGSCWAFAVAAAVESRLLMNGRGYVDLSEQQLLDCDTQHYGCIGGFPDLAIEWIKRNGITSEAYYPYVAYKKSCTVRSTFPKYTFNAYYTGYFNGNEQMMMDWIQYGPLVIRIFATKNFEYYRSGVFTDYTCPANGITNHAVLAVGYGTENGLDYWLIKNSYGTTYGMNGYIKMRRNLGSMCSVGFVGYLVY